MQVVLRIRTPPERPLARGRRSNRPLAFLGASMLLPAGWLSFAVCLWRLSFELSLDRTFPIRNGLLAHWQVWFVAGSVLNLLGLALARYAEPRSPQSPGV